MHLIHGDAASNKQLNAPAATTHGDTDSNSKKQIHAPNTKRALLYFAQEFP
jgi:hypothetical protein